MTDQTQIAVRQEREAAKFATVFLVIFALGFLLAETMSPQHSQVIGVTFGVILALLGASISEEQERASR
jgi:threonine/homoserine efflux transporter RhtA